MEAPVPERCSPRRGTGPGPPAGPVRGSGGGEKMGDGLGRPKPARSPWDGGSTEPLSVPRVQPVRVCVQEGAVSVS